MTDTDNKKRILIVGNSAKEHALAKEISGLRDVEKVFVAPGNKATKEIAECVDIREDDVDGLFEFAIKNNITLTIVSSDKALKADVAGMFGANEQPVFATERECADFALSKSVAKRLLYKLHIPTSKFGIFDKPYLATDYVKSSKFPLLISTDNENEASPKAVVVNNLQAKTVISDLEFQGANKFIIEDYVYGHSFTIYFITDGVTALPIGVVGDYKFKENGNGGLYTLGAAAYSPDYKISFDLIGDFVENVCNKILEENERKGKTYVGILGFECVLTCDGSYVVTNIIPFLKDHDAQTVLNQLDTNILELMESCANGSFSDMYNDIPILDLATVSCVLFSRKDGAIITGLDLIDEDTAVNHFATDKNQYLEYLTNKGRTLVVTQTASTFTKAKELLYDNIDEIHFEGKSFRSDLGDESL